MHRAALLVLVAACTDPGPASVGDALDDPQLPPRGDADLRAWLAAGYYRAWRCEPAVHAARSPSPHGANRICNNAAIEPFALGFPAGAASVKELVEGGTIIGHAVSRRLTDEPGGDAWYWYEAQGDHVFANGAGAGNCTGCHDGALRDYVFTVVPGTSEARTARAQLPD